MKRHYYLSDDLDDLQQIERDLEQAGITAPQIHVLSLDDAGVEAHSLHNVEAVLRKDVVRGTELGAVVGVIGAALILAAAHVSGIAQTYTWVPAIFLAVVVLGFCTWEGGLIGIQEPHTDFRRFQDELEAGRHLLFVDIDQAQQAALDSVVDAHPGLRRAGEGAARPTLVVRGQETFQRFMKTAP